MLEGSAARAVADGCVAALRAEQAKASGRTAAAIKTERIIGRDPLAPGHETWKSSVI
jgi:hypothetical protein